MPSRFVSISSPVVAQHLTADSAAATSTVEVVWDSSLGKKKISLNL